jgi:hypothetical protein
MPDPERADAGQAFPIYITVVAGLLFLALAYLAVGQAAATRSEAQTAVVESRCSFKPPAEAADDEELPELSCKGGDNWDLDPDDLADLPHPEDLFDVHLAD